MHLRVILADDHPIVIAGAKQCLETSVDIRVVAEASNADGLMALLREVPCDVLVTDYVMPGGVRADGDSMIRHLRRQYPNLPIVLLTMTSNVALLSKALEAGVTAVVDKGAGMSELPKATRMAFARRSYFSPKIRAIMDELVQPSAKSAIQLSLSAKEMDVIRKFCEGRSVTEIANDLHKSVATVSRQKTAGMRKLGVQNDVELLDYMRSFNLPT
ncbi:response regulator [Dyella sp. Tek66A03]|uniref:response regulator n=1 Tax=Dyella sp. Tek66A03 TaxID=3458298 RepID=UPI00403E6C13